MKTKVVEGPNGFSGVLKFLKKLNWFQRYKCLKIE